MLHRTFQLFVVISLVVFTAAGLVLFIPPLALLLRPTETNGIVVMSGGLSARLFNLTVIAVILLAIAGLYLISRRSKLR